MRIAGTILFAVMISVFSAAAAAKGDAKTELKMEDYISVEQLEKIVGQKVKMKKGKNGGKRVSVMAQNVRDYTTVTFMASMEDRSMVIIVMGIPSEKSSSLKNVYTSVKEKSPVLKPVPDCGDEAFFIHDDESGARGVWVLKGTHYVNVAIGRTGISDEEHQKLAGAIAAIVADAVGKKN